MRLSAPIGRPRSRGALPAGRGRRLALVALAALVAAAADGCAYGPPRVEPSYARPPADAGALHGYVSRLEDHLAPGESAVRLLARNDEAYSARLALAEEATQTLDVQYFLWNDDATAHYLARLVIAAAERGVRVRVLLDDLALDGHDADYAALDSHPNIEVRTFNPWRSRLKPLRFLEYLVHMNTLNHRMHNKAIIADNELAITGGRNVGNHYFGLDPEFVQNDLDVIVAGPVVGEISEHFDLYWNSDEAYPVDAVLKPRQRGRSFEAVVDGIEQTYEHDSALLGQFLPRGGERGEFLESIADSFDYGPVELWYDSPRVEVEPPTRLYEQYKGLLARAQREVLISSPYFVPDQAFVDLLDSLTDRGVRVVVLTNSLGANNHTTAHSAYKQWRRKILRAGVELYEARRDAASLSYYLTPPVEADRLGLHSKAAVVDGRFSFVGSPNVDPRSMVLNTEIGIVVDDRAFAAELTDLFERDTAPRNAWRVGLTDDNFLFWSDDDETIMHQPARGFPQRVVEFFINLLPIKKQT